MLYGVFTIALKELQQLRRAPVTLTNTVVFPFVLMLLFCYALSGRLQGVPTVVLDEDRSRLSRSVLTGFENSEQFRVTHYARDYREMQDLLLAGKAKVGVFLPTNLHESALKNRLSRVVVVIDGSDSITATAILNETSKVVRAISGDITVAGATPRAEGGQPPVEFISRVWFNPDLLDINFIVPGVLGIVLFFFATQVVALEVAKEREEGTMEQLNVSPLRPYELILGKSVPYLCIFSLEVPILLLIARWMFDATMRGSMVLVCAVSMLFVVGNIATGLLISSVSSTQRDADNLANLVLLPSMLITGALFSFEKMPWFGKAVAEVLPLTHYLRAVRAIMLKGVGFSMIWQEVALLAGYCVALYLLSTLSLKKVSR